MLDVKRTVIGIILLSVCSSGDHPAIDVTSLSGGSREDPFHVAGVVVDSGHRAGDSLLHRGGLLRVTSSEHMTNYTARHLGSASGSVNLGGDGDKATPVSLLAAVSASKMACSSPLAFQDTHRHLDKLLRGIEMKLVASLATTVTQSAAEASVVEDLRHALEEAHHHTERCEQMRETARNDALAYNRELRELAAVVSSGEGKGRSEHDSEWSALSLLGERSVRGAASGRRGRAEAEVGSVSSFRADAGVRIAQGVKRAAELHWSVAKATQAVDTVCEPPRGTLAETEAENGQVQRSCSTARDRLNVAYQEASSHIRDLQANAETRANDDSCFQAALALLEDRRAAPVLRIRAARKELCDAHRTGDEIDSEIREVQSLLARSHDLLSTTCAADEAWSRYSSAITSLLNLASTRPLCPQCCADEEPAVTGAQR